MPSDLAPIAVRGRDLVEESPEGERRFVAWGFNYDWTLRDGRATRLEDLLRSAPQRIDDDFAAMHALGANAVRVFIPTSAVLAGPDRADPRLGERLGIVFAAARQHGLRLVVTGLAHVRADGMPRWLRDADDATVERAEETFWRALASAGRAESAILAYDLQNEPAVPWTDTDERTRGCFDVLGGDRYCYVHLRLRRVGEAWTRDIHERFASPAALRARFPDFPRAEETWDAIAIPAEDRSDPRWNDYVAFHGRLLGAWAARLRRVIREQDATHLVTVGALDPLPMRAAVDLYAVHLYPETTALLAKLPDDKPVLVEEIFPFALKPGENAPGARILDQLIDATKQRAAGWLTFYFGPPALQRPPPNTSADDFRVWLDAYRATLARWSAGPPS